jgi:hypothetical protein
MKGEGYFNDFVSGSSDEEVSQLRYRKPLGKRPGQDDRRHMLIWMETPGNMTILREDLDNGGRFYSMAEHLNITPQLARRRYGTYMENYANAKSVSVCIFLWFRSRMIAKTKKRRRISVPSSSD